MLEAFFLLIQQFDSSYINQILESPLLDTFQLTYNHISSEDNATTLLLQSIITFFDSYNDN